MVAPLTTDEPGAIGPYEVVGRLGHGGLFLGRAPGGEHVAITAVPADLAVDPGFRAEVAGALTASVAAVAPVVDADLDGPVPWLATAYAAGPTLAEAVRDHGPMPADMVLELAAWLAEGLRAWHAAGLVHRNLDPSNVVLAAGGPRMVGFGTGPWASGSSGLPGAESGSAGFWSPEQALGQDVGPPSDIFSLGAVLVFAGGGVGPFGSGSSALLMYRVVNSPASLDGLGGKLRGLVGSCLAKEPGERPDASRLLAELEAIRSTAVAGSSAVPGSSAVAGASAGASAVAGVASPSAVAGSSGVASPSAVAGSSAVAGGVASPSADAGAFVGASGPGGGRGGGRHSRLGWPGSRVGTWIAGGLLAVACVVAIFFLSGGDPLSSAGNVQPQAGAADPVPDSTSQAPLIMSSSPSVPSGSSPAQHQGPAPGGVSPATLQDPSPSSFLSPSVSPHVFSPPASPSPSRSSSPSPSRSSSPSPSKSPSPSPSPSKSPSPSPSPSKSPSPSPSPSKSGSPSPSSSTSQTGAAPHSTSPTTSAASAPTSSG